MLPSKLLRLSFLVGTALVLRQPAGAAEATGCCSAAPALPGGASPTPALAFTFRPPAPLSRIPGPAAADGQFNRRLPHHRWLMGGVHATPSAYLPMPETSNAERSAFSQAGVGIGYMVSPSLRAISNWNTGLNSTSVSPGSQFTVGISRRR